MKHHKELIFTEKLPGFLSPIQGTNIYSGKKNEVIHLNQLDADLSSNNYRQIMAKVPGVSIWESDGSGIQTSVSTRGLSPNRSWEFNVRQNG
jgi:Fe(3+) dicitrate transport protein